MLKSLPPLDHLRAFEAAARLLSFKHAATEMNVTPAAVGQRIRALEGILNSKLFVRQTRQVALTAEGRLLFEDVSPLLTGLKACVSRHWNRRESRVLSISTTNSFAELNLLPRLPSFTDHNRDAEVRIISTNEKLDLEQEDVDVCIRLGPDAPEGFECYALGEQPFVPVCSPSLLLGRSEPTFCKEILELPLIEEEWPVQHLAAPSWKKWATRRGIDFRPNRTLIKVSLESHAVRAATQGQGVALIRLGAIEELVKEGRLIELLSPDGRDSSVFQYRITWRKGERSDLVNSFVAWARNALK